MPSNYSLFPALIEAESIINSKYVILDTSFVMPGTPVSARESYEREHIPGARFFDIESVADHTTDLPHMLPSADDFAAAVSKLGISNDTSVVVYGQNGIVMGPARAWWMFRAFGHRGVRVLNGGLPAWKSAGLETESGPAPMPAPGTYSAKLNTALVRDLSAMKQIADDRSAQMLDARPAERFAGTVAEPRPGLRAGHIPGSVNIPCLNLIDVHGKMKPKQELATIFESNGINPEHPIITTCGSGVTACVIALALYELGYPDVPVYDGSWSEWGREDSGTKVVTA